MTSSSSGCVTSLIPHMLLQYCPFGQLLLNYVPMLSTSNYWVKLTHLPWITLENSQGASP